MNDQIDIDRILDRWLGDATSAMPERVAIVVADRIDHQKQRRTWRLPWRLHDMNPLLKAGAAVAAVVLVAIIGVGLLPRAAPGIGGPAPTPSPTATPSATPTPAPLPDGLLTGGDYVAHALPGDSMAFIVTVPQGWSGFGGWALGGPDRSAPANSVGIAFLHAPQVVTDPCAQASAGPTPMPSPPSVDDLVAALSSHPGVRMSGLTDTTIAGYTGKRLDVQLPAELPCSQYYVFAEPQGFYAQGPSNHWRVWVLDVDGEPGVVVLSEFASTTADDRLAAQGVIDSLRIEP